MTLKPIYSNSHCIAILFILYYIPLQAQTFTASQLDNDAYIDLEWSLDADPCLIDAMSNPYNRIRIKILADGTEVYEEILEDEDLEGFYVPQPNLDTVSQRNPDNFGLYLLSPPEDFLNGGIENYTIETWGKRVDQGEIFVFSNSLPTGITDFIITSNNHLLVRDPFGEVDLGTIPLIENQWFHFAFVSNVMAGTMDIIFNGQLISSLTNTFPLGPVFYIMSPSSTDLTTVELGEIRLFDQIRSVTSIQNTLANISINEPHLIGLFRFNSNGITDDLTLGGTTANYFGLQEMVPFETAGAGSPVAGTFRHEVGPDQNISYTLELDYGPFAQTEPECSGLQTSGSTKDVIAPSFFNATSSLINKIRVRFRHSSSLADYYDIYRDTIKIGTIDGNLELEEFYSVIDSFIYEDPTSIESSTSYQYLLKMVSTITNTTYTFGPDYGTTRITELFAFHNNDSEINVSWETLVGLPAESNIELWRKGDRIALLPRQATGFIDTKPVHGERVEYNLRAVSNGAVFVSDFASDSLPPNGVISGMVISEDDKFPIAGVTVTATRSGTNESFYATTDEVGTFVIDDISYGLMDSLILSASLSGHNFVYPNNPISLNLNNFHSENNIIIDTTNFLKGNAVISIQSFNLTADETLDKVVVDWSVTASMPNPIVELSRNGDLIFIEKGDAFLNHSIEDFGGRPKKESNYTLRVYTLNGLTGTQGVSQQMIPFPDVSDVPANQLIATPSMSDLNNVTGNIDLTWTEYSNNIDGFRLYRNGESIAELSSDSLSYTDTQAPFDTELLYSITKIRVVENITYESSPPTIATPELLDLGLFPAPTSVTATPISDVGYMKVSWTENTSIDADFDFSGFHIYRDAIRIGTIFNGNGLLYKDKLGLDQAYVYSVSMYKLNNDGTEIESAKTSIPNAVNYPPVPAPATLQAFDGGANNGYTDVGLIWEASTESTNFDGWIVLQDGVLIDKLPWNSIFTIAFVEPGATSQFELRAYKQVGQTIRESQPLFATASAQPFSSNLPAPQNVTVTKNYENQIKICWEYDAFIPAEFIIRRANDILDTVSTETRTYYYHDIDPNEVTAHFQVQAYYSGSLSPNVELSAQNGERGQANKTVLIYGRVFDNENNQAVVGAEIKLKASNSTQDQTRTYTDSTGFYSLRLDKLAPTFNVDLKVSTGDCDDCLSQTININNSLGQYNRNFSLSNSTPLIEEKIAAISHISATSDTHKLNAIIHFEMSSDQWDGVEFSKGIEERIDIMQGQNQFILDNNGVPGITYKYIFTPYLINGNEKELGETFDFDYTFPALAPVENLSATPMKKYNRIDVQWSHPYNHADRYLVIKNGLLFGEIQKGENFLIRDSLGVPGETYEYTLIAVKLIDGAPFFSEERRVNAIFPEIGKVQKLTATIPFTDEYFGNGNPNSNISGYTLNHVELTWQYLDSSIAGFKIYRDGEVIDFAEGDIRSYIDFDGTPGIFSDYEISVVSVRNDVRRESQKASVISEFPELSQPYNVGRTTRNNLGDMLATWDYLPDGATGFDLYRYDVSSSSTELIASIPAVISEVDTTVNYEYVDRVRRAPTDYYRYEVVAYKMVNGVKFTSAPQKNNGNIAYPKPPGVSGYELSDYEFISAIKHGWEYNEDVFFDGFKITTKLLAGNTISTTIIEKNEREKFIEITSTAYMGGNLTCIIAPYRTLPDTLFGNLTTKTTVDRPSSQNSYGPFIPANVQATDGILTNTKIEWTSTCVSCDPTNQFFYIWRDGELIGQVDVDVNLFFDDPSNLVSGASHAAVGKEYYYEITNIDTYLTTFYNRNVDGDLGSSKRNGKISGFVYSDGTSNGVPGVDVTVRGIDLSNGNIYEDSFTSLSDGSFSINELYYGETEIKYGFTAKYLDHQFDYPDSALIAPTSNISNTNVIFDLTATIINGVVKKQNAFCGLENIVMFYKQTVGGSTTVVDSTLTNSDGFYSFNIRPNVANLQVITIEGKNISTEDIENPESNQMRHEIVSVGSNVFTNFNDFPNTTELNFTDILTYPITIKVENACGEAIADQPIGIRIYTLDACYDQMFETNVSGFLDVDLPAFNYEFVVTNLVGSGVTNYENAAKNYLELRPSSLSLFDIHKDAGDMELDTIVESKLIYHRVANVQVSSSFDRFLCDDPFEAAIIEQGSRHNLSFTITEEHQGMTCEVTEGYVVVRNGAAENPISEPIMSQGLSFSGYSFTTGSPNLIAPHKLNINVQYFSENDVLLGSTNLEVIVEGAVQLPGTGIQTNADGDGGAINMPLFVLRDPPGDKSSTTLQEGTTIKQSLSFNRSNGGSFGLFVDGKTVVLPATVGLFYSADIRGGRNTKENATYDISLTTSQSYSTSSASGAVGRDASVIVGAGLSTQYGLQRSIEFEDNCTPSESTQLAYGIGGFQSQYVYTIEFIEDLISDYERDIQRVQNGTLILLDRDGLALNEGFAVAKLDGLKQGWEQVIEYYDVQTTPHYVLCADQSFKDSISDEASIAYQAWQIGFCNQIGEYQNGTFVQDDEITWTPELINAYNNTIAFTEKLKEIKPGQLLNGDLKLSNNELEDANILITQQYHGLLGTDLKSAEIKDISGGSGGYTRTVKGQRSSKSSHTAERFYTADVKLGVYFKAKLSLFGVDILESENKIGLRATQKISIGSTRTDVEASNSSIKYTIADDDSEDQITTLILQGAKQNHSPMFIRLGGQSSCPYEGALTPNQDNAPLMVDDPGITVVMNPITEATSMLPPKIFNIEEGNAGIFQIRVTNMSGTFDERDIEVFLDQNSNPFGAIITLGGTSLNNGAKIIDDVAPFGSIDQFLLVERPAGTPFYNFDNIRIGAKPKCGGSAEFITISVSFKTDCSPISLVSPIDHFVVNRQNPNDVDDQEVIPFEIRDYQSGNINLQHVQLQYRRLGTGSSWLNVPGGILTRQFLADVDAGNAIGSEPSYFWEWDITGQYGLLPDGEYQVRALAFCGISGIIYSNVVQGEISRSALLNTGYPEPADGIWTEGDEISASYLTDIDCGVLNTTDSIGNYFKLIDKSTNEEVPFNLVCQGNKLAIETISPMSNYDNHIMQATYLSISNLAGNIAPDIVWEFRVITQAVDWAKNVIEVNVFEGDTTTMSVNIMNTNEMIVNNLSLQGGSSSWLTYQPSGSFNVPIGGLSTSFEMMGNQAIGTYVDTIFIDGIAGRIPQLQVIMNVVKKPIVPAIDPSLPDSMRIVANWRFVNGVMLSTDTLDQIHAYVDGEIRGIGKIEKVNDFIYAAILEVFGDQTIDEGAVINFGVYDASSGNLYDNVDFDVINYSTDAVIGTVTDPEILIVDSTLLTIGGGNIIYVDISNDHIAQDGQSWETAFDDLQEALNIAQNGNQIWMAEGVYLPSPNGNRDASFEVDKSIEIYGGLTTGDVTLDNRGENDLTILSGEIGNIFTAVDNSYQVFKTTTGVQALLDNITLSAGNANGGAAKNSGAAVVNLGMLLMRNCSINEHQTAMNGAAIDNAGTLTFESGTFRVIANQSAVKNYNNAELSITGTVEIIQE